MIAIIIKQNTRQTEVSKIMRHRLTNYSLTEKLSDGQVAGSNRNTVPFHDGVQPAAGDAQ